MLEADYSAIRRIRKWLKAKRETLVEQNARLIGVSTLDEAKLTAGKILQLDEVLDLIFEVVQAANGEEDDEPTP